MTLLSPQADINTAKVSVEMGNSLSEAARTGAFWLISGAQLICGIGCGFMMTHIVIFATDIGYSAMIGATFMSVQGIFNLVGVLLTGYLSDRIARNRVLALTHFIRSLVFRHHCRLPADRRRLALDTITWPWHFSASAGFTTAPLTSGLVADLFGYKRMGTIIGMITTVPYDRNGARESMPAASPTS